MTKLPSALRAAPAGKLLHFFASVPFVITLILAAPLTVCSGAQAASRTFEVATVKPSDTKNPLPPSVNITPDRFQATGLTFKELVKIAFNLNYGADEQVSGGPSWVSSARFDIDAKEDAAIAAELAKLPEQQQGDEVRRMLRTLFAERFHLQIHHETRSLPVYELVLAKSGPKLLPAAAQPGTQDGETPAKPRNFIRFAGRGQLEANGANSSMLVTALSMQPEVDGRLVLDKTGLNGSYDFTLKWTPDIGAASAAPAADSGPSLFTALQEELGLRLASARAPVDRIVIDRVDLPSAN
jgi:uncharacterized protein (TIGR03435 family)